jgi:DNA-binding MarR family transcriptional regulator
MNESRVKPPVSSAELADRLHSAAIRFLRRLRRTDAESGLTGPQGSALSVLVFGGETTPGRLAAIEQVSAPSISRLVKELEATGLVRRRVDPADGRGVLLEPTEKGRALLDRARDLRLGRLTAALAALPAEDRAVLARAARLLADLGEGDALG